MQYTRVSHATKVYMIQFIKDQKRGHKEPKIASQPQYAYKGHQKSSHLLGANCFFSSHVAHETLRP